MQKKLLAILFLFLHLNSSFHVSGFQLQKIEREEIIKEVAPPTKVEKVVQQAKKDTVQVVAPLSMITLLITQFKDYATELKGVATYLPIMGQLAAILVALSLCFALFNIYKKWREV